MKKITALLLCSVISLGAALTLASCGDDPDPSPNEMPDFDYINEDLSRYVYISAEKYKSFSVNAEIREPSEVDTEFAIIRQLYRFRKRVGNGEYKTEGTLTAGDRTYIYYRGYTIGKDGTKDAFDGGCNFSDASPYELQLGSGGFITGFEYDLIGEQVENYPVFEKIKEGEIKDTQVVYISGVRTDGTSTESLQNKRVDLSEDVDAIMGQGFKAALVGKNIGAALESFKTTLGDKEYTYSPLKVSFATECESDPIVVETYFPHNYGEASLAGKTAYFEVYVQKYIDFEVPELTDDFIREEYEELSVDLAKLDTYEGESLVDKYRNYIKAGLLEEYEEQRQALIESAAWTYLLANTEVKEHPKTAVEKQFAVYHLELTQLYEYYSMYYSFNSLGDFVKAWYSLSSDADWEEYVTLQAKAAVAEKLMFYYIIKNENWLPSSEEFERLYNEAVDKDLEEELENQGCTPDKYTTNAEYEAARSRIRAELIEKYGETHYSDVAYYEYGMKEILKGVTVNPSASIS